MHLGNDGRSIHDNQERRSGRCYFSWIRSALSNDPIDRAANLGVAKLRLRSQILSACRFQLAACRLEFLLFTYSLQCVPMLLRNLVLTLYLRQADAGLVQIFSRQSALLVQILPAVE